jgi:glycerol uptake facilitator protein
LARPQDIWKPGHSIPLAILGHGFWQLAGYDQAAFPSPENYWWVPIAAPLLGGTLGAGLYQIAVKPYLPSRSKSGAPGDTDMPVK